MKNTLKVLALLNLITAVGQCQYEMVHFVNNSVKKGVIKVRTSGDHSLRTLSLNDFLGLNAENFRFKSFTALASFSDLKQYQKIAFTTQVLHDEVLLDLFSQKMYQVTRGAPFLNIVAG